MTLYIRRITTTPKVLFDLGVMPQGQFRSLIRNIDFKDLSRIQEAGYRIEDADFHINELVRSN